MTVNIEALIRGMNKPYQTIRDAGIITYNPPPKGTQHDPFLTLDMKSEGVFLSFDNNESRPLTDITLRIKTDKKSWKFPGQLPLELQQDMSRQWVHEKFGNPDKSIPPKVLFNMEFGWRDRFTVDGFHTPITMIVLFDMTDMVKSVSFIPTAKLRW